jgi:hypothetical protein
VVEVEALVAVAQAAQRLTLGCEVLRSVEQRA